jgi:hypothetical protein
MLVDVAQQQNTLSMHSIRSGKNDVWTADSSVCSFREATGYFPLPFAVCEDVAGL